MIARLRQAALNVNTKGGREQWQSRSRSGRKLPDFTLQATQGGKVTLSQYKGEKNVLLAFYILDFTGG